MSGTDPRLAPYLLPCLALALLASMALALATGPLCISPGELLGMLGLSPDVPAPHIADAMLQLRLPRVLLAAVAGATLAMAGAAMQGLLRNPLADPGLIGVSSGAALAGAITLVLFSGSIALPLLLPLSSFAGGALAAALALWLARREGHTRIVTVLLVGLALNGLAGAGIGFVAQLADDLALRSLNFWMFGSLGKASWREILAVLPLLLLPLLLLPRHARSLDALLLGEPEAAHLGVDTETLKRSVLALSVLAVASTVAVAGIIGFVGLVVPHLMRLASGPDHGRLLPASALGGAILLVLADTAARSLFVPSELPVGVLTALLGAPFFLALLLRYRHGSELA